MPPAKANETGEGVGRRQGRREISFSRGLELGILPAPFPMALIVQKYGGTSVGNPERILNVARRVIETQAAGHSVGVVVSAMAS